MPLDPKFVTAARARMAAVDRYKSEVLAARRQLLASRLPAEEKVCGACWLLLPASSFHANDSQPDGLEPRCRRCRSSLRSAALGAKGSSAAGRRASGAGRRSYARRAEVPSFTAAVADWGHKRRKWAGAGPATGADVLAVLAGARGRCAYCHRPAGSGPGGLDIDHAVQRSRGGAHERANLVAACAPCRRDKGDQEPWAWLASRGFVAPRAPALWAYVPRLMIEAKGKPCPRP